MPINNSNGVYIKDITVIDPDTLNEVDLEIWKDNETGGMFGVDISFLDHSDGEYYSPFTGEMQLLDEADIT